MNKNNLAIGVFDSGMGGLTILKALKTALPNESFIYLGDMARLPYGTKSYETVKQYAIQMANMLVERGVKAIFIACNTATTVALSYLQSMLPDIPVLGVVEPGARMAVQLSSSKRIYVMATQRTIVSNAYDTAMLAIDKQVKVTGIACSLLVALAEEGMLDNDIAKLTLSHYLKALTDEDTIVLGCTHFPVFKKTLQAMLPNVRIVDAAEASSMDLSACLSTLNLMCEPTNQPYYHYLVTDNVSRFLSLSPIFLGETLDPTMIELVDVLPT
jgi:glutamate racemase